MSEFKGTPGIWHQSHRERKDGMWSTEVYDDAGETIAEMRWCPKPKDEKGCIGSYCADNAKLIAAAPELLSALIALTSNPHLNLGDLVYTVRENEGKGWDGEAVKSWSDAVQNAGFAIRKALDGEPQEMANNK